MHSNYFSNITLIGFICVLFCSVLTYGNETKYSEEERKAIEKFRPQVESILTRDYMKEDIYLLKFLRANNLNVDTAVGHLKDTLKWRQDNNIDNILKENFSQVYKNAPYWMNSVDKDGAPVLIINNGRWDIRKYSVSGKRDSLTRYWDQMLERIEVKLREIRKSKGKDVQAIFIMNIEGHNARQQGCFSCVSIFFEWMTHTEKYYPENFKLLYIINGPRAFTPLFDILKPAMAPYTQKILRYYGPNKKEWSEDLLKYIPADQLTPQYGGTRKKL